MPHRRFRFSVFLRALRPHQWTKNLLTFVPIALAHKITQPFALVRSIGALAVFCLAASSIYLWNDLADLDSDRRHPVKRRRPLAAGDLSIRVGVVAAVLLGLAAIAGALCLSRALAFTVALYIAVSVTYSLLLKKLLLVDVVVLACLYVARIFAGGFASQIRISHFTTAFALFFFFSLATLKRFVECRNCEGALPGRAYVQADARLLRLIGIASALASVCTVGLYIQGPDAPLLYRHTAVLWGICPLLLYWCGRLWVLAGRGAVQEDPVVFALADRPSWAILVLIVLTAYIAS